MFDLAGGKDKKRQLFVIVTSQGLADLTKTLTRMIVE